MILQHHYNIYIFFLLQKKNISLISFLGIVNTTKDALIIFGKYTKFQKKKNSHYVHYLNIFLRVTLIFFIRVEACRLGILYRIMRRLTEEEKKNIRVGSV